MQFAITHFNVDSDTNYPSETLVLKSELHEIEVTTSPMGLVVGFLDSNDYYYEWFEDGKEWVDEDHLACEAPEEWDENFWNVVKQAEKTIYTLQGMTIGIDD